MAKINKFDEFQKKADEILDKISDNGMDSLTDREKTFLKNFSSGKKIPFSNISDDGGEKNIIEFIRPHALNLGENFEYIATFIKEEEEDEESEVEKYRILAKGLNTGRQFLFFLGCRPDFFGRERSYSIEYIEIGGQFGQHVQFISPDHIKSEVETEHDGIHEYNYHKIGSNKNTVHEFFDIWKNSDPMIHVGNKLHQFISRINNYSGSYKFDGKIY